MSNQKNARLSRKDFISNAAGVCMGGLFGISEVASMEKTTANAKASRPLGANDTIRIAGIGIGGEAGGSGRGLSDIRTAANLPGVRIVALCDLYAPNLESAAASFHKGVTTTRDFREVLDRNDIDAVIIGTPDHWHALLAMAALKAGKHVYCEKPLTLTIDEGKKLVSAWKKSALSFQVGSQLRSDPRYRLAILLAQNGKLGEIRTVEAHLPTGPTGGPFSAEPIPADFDFNMWLGPRPPADYNPRRCFGSFRYFMDYSGGNLTDFGAHMNDIAQWGLGFDRSGPIEVDAEILKPPFDDYPSYQKTWVESRIRGKKTPLPVDHNNWYDTVPIFRVTYTYENGVRLVTSNNLNDYGITFRGSTGWVSVTLNSIRASDDSLLQEPITIREKEMKVPLDYKGNFILQDDKNHMLNFLDSIRTGSKTECDTEIGHRSATVCHLGNISMLLGRKLHWDPKKEEFVHDQEANAFLRRLMRKPWTL